MVNIFSIAKKIIVNPFVIGILLYIVIFIIPFGFLTTFDFEEWKYAPFVQSIVGTFMGGGTIAIITAGLLVFQKRLDSEHKRKEDVFKKRIEVYHKVIQQLAPRFIDGKFSQDDIQQAELLKYEVALVASKEVQEEYNEFLDQVNESTGEEGEINDLNELNNKFMDIVEDMSKTLEMGDVERRIAVENDQIDLERSEIITKSQGELETKDLIQWIKKEVLKNLPNSDELKEKYSPTGGLTVYFNKKKFLGAGGRIMIRRDEKRNYIRPKSYGNLKFADIREYSPKKAKSYTIPWGYSFYEAKIDFEKLTEQEKKIIAQLIKNSHRMVQPKSKPLSLKRAEHRKLAKIFVKGDSVKNPNAAWDISELKID